ncbi:hypothetical protein U7230_03685 [Carboxydochorda subterranea]|uniref:MoaD/ThiS family protein n=1 Tax=Carboxydichorda subterranea TaxID=3109565 RepID=A0ABZ1BZ90_9FIRM|nr:hypothetical protein [Limnochorda sp. L945t]WRP18117.1 hypothetical protein U7230_03685 [Limnochorda sp. L945t]
MDPLPGKIRVILPGHLCRLAGLQGRVVEVPVSELTPGVPEPTLGTVLEELERAHPALRGTLMEIRAGAPARLRPYLRAFAASIDLTPAGLDATLPPEVGLGEEPLRVVGAIAGG